MSATLRLDTLAHLWDAFEEACLDADGELTPALAEQHEALQLATPEAVDNFCLYLRSLEHSQTSLRDMEAELAAKRAKLARRVECLKALAFKLVEARGTVSKTGSKSLKGEHYALGSQQNGGVEPLEVACADPDLYPAHLRKVTVTVDEERVRAEAKAHGGELLGPTQEGEKFVLARLLPRGRHLRVR